MSQIEMFDESEPLTPSAGSSIFWVDSATKTLKSKDSNGTVHNYGLADTSTIEMLSAGSSTGVLTGCQTEVNPIDATTFDISAGVLIFSNAHINPNSPTLYKLVYAGSTGNPVPRLATHDDSLITISSTGVVSTSDLVAGTDYSLFRDECFVGILLHPGRDVVIYTTDGIGYCPVNTASSLADYAISNGFINLKNGNVFSGSGMNLNKTAGWLFQLGLNKPNLDNPNVFYNPASTPNLISYIYCDGVGDYVRSPLGYTVETKYDNAGTLTALGANEWAIQYLYFNGVFAVIQYGQHKYDSKADAEAAINVETLTECPELGIYTSFRGWMVLSGSTTDLSDPLQASIFQSDKFGTHCVTGGLKTNATTLQGAYNNAIEPEIKLTPTRGSFVIQDANTSIAAPLLEVKNSNAVKTIFDVSPTVINFNEKIRLETNAIAWEDLRIGGNLRAGGNPQPTFSQITGLGNLFLYKFGAGTQDSLYCTVQMPHNWKEGTNIFPHIHWLTEDSNAGNIVWTLEYSWQNYLGTFGASTIIEAVSTNSTLLKHNITGFSAIAGTGKTISSILMIRISRNGPSASDTYAGLASLIEFDIHYQIDSLGSATSTSKD